MLDILCPIIELAVVFPATLLAYLPMKNHLRVSKGKLILVFIPALIILCFLGGTVSFLHNIKTIWIAIPVMLIIGVIYCCTLNISLWKSISVILAIYGCFACIESFTRSLTYLLCNNHSLWLNLYTGIIFNIACWLFFTLVYYPAVHSAANLLEDEGIAQTWYVFWILPVTFIALNLFITPINPMILYQSRIIQIYITISIVLLLILLLFYVMFYLMAKNLNKNNLLRQENQFLSMQQTQYEMLCNAIDETRQARHDMRHHFSALLALANRKEWSQLEDYLSKTQKSIPNSELNLCDNPTVDGIAGHYGMLYKNHEIPFSFELDLPRELLISKIDISIVLSNLLENALEASLRTEKTKRNIRTQAYLYSSNVMIISVENTFNGIIKEKNGIFQSSKRKGDGVGIQSIRRIAKKNGGYCKFTCLNDVFCADIMLRGEK